MKIGSIQRQSSERGSSRSNTADGGQWKGSRSSSKLSNRNSLSCKMSNGNSLSCKMSNGNSLSSNMSNKSAGGVNMNLSFDTRMCDNINTLGGVASLCDSLGLCDALLLL